MSKNVEESLSRTMKAVPPKRRIKVKWKGDILLSVVLFSALISGTWCLPPSAFFDLSKGKATESGSVKCLPESCYFRILLGDTVV